MFRLCRADGQDEEGELGGERVDRQWHQRRQDHLPGTHSSSRAVRSRTEENNSHNMGRHAQINSSQCYPGECCYSRGSKTFIFADQISIKKFKNSPEQEFLKPFFVLFGTYLKKDQLINPTYFQYDKKVCGLHIECSKFTWIGYIKLVCQI